jgi:acetylornithine deacetylase/succinyl-diaminopimelate desuccinylase-like protein
MAVVRRVAAKAWPGAVVVPTLATGGSDSRFLRPLGVKAFGIGRLPGTLAERAEHAGHGPDERRPAKWIPAYFRYVRSLVEALAM